MEKIKDFGVTIFAGAEAESIIVTSPSDKPGVPPKQEAFASRGEFFHYIETLIDKE